MVFRDASASKNVEISGTEISGCCCCCCCVPSCGFCRTRIEEFRQQQSVIFVGVDVVIAVVVVVVLLLLCFKLWFLQEFRWQQSVISVGVVVVIAAVVVVAAVICVVVVVVMFQAVVAVEQGSGSVGGSNQCQRRVQPTPQMHCLHLQQYDHAQKSSFGLSKSFWWPVR